MELLRSHHARSFHQTQTSELLYRRLPTRGYNIIYKTPRIAKQFFKYTACCNDDHDLATQHKPQTLQHLTCTHEKQCLMSTQRVCKVP